MSHFAPPYTCTATSYKLLDSLRARVRDTRHPLSLALDVTRISTAVYIYIYIHIVIANTSHLAIYTSLMKSCANDCLNCAGNYQRIDVLYMYICKKFFFSGCTVCVHIYIRREVRLGCEDVFRRRVAEINLSASFGGSESNLRRAIARERERESRPSLINSPNARGLSKIPKSHLKLDRRISRLLRLREEFRPI